MLNRNKMKNVIHFTADVFMCELRGTGSGLTYWNLRLLRKGELIDAYHWSKMKTDLFQYQSNDSVLIEGCWVSPEYKRLQVIRSKIVSAYAANDDAYNPVNSQQLEFDFG